MSILLILIVIAAIVVLAGIGIYNRLVKLKNQAEESWSGIDVQLKRRYDLVPNLVETVKGYASHEKDTLQKVIEARNSAMNTTGVESKAQAENQLTGALKTIFALAEAYPDLKANQGFQDLQSNLTGIEEDIQNARRYYNAVVRDLNTACETFPSGLIANSFGFSKRQYFEIAEAERANVKVQF